MNYVSAPPHFTPNQTRAPTLSACLPACPQMTDVLRRYPDAAEACVETIAAIPEDVRALGLRFGVLALVCLLAKCPFWVGLWLLGR